MENMPLSQDASGLVGGQSGHGPTSTLDKILSPTQFLLRSHFHINTAGLNPAKLVGFYMTTLC
jgi:hypothetical protein